MATVMQGINLFRAETWNLMFLVLDVESPKALSGSLKNVPAACWKSVTHDMRTGQFINPFLAEARGRRVADLLMMPPADFVAWAENSPAAQALPLKFETPDWVAKAKSRLHLCALHLDQPLTEALDAPVTSVKEAADLLTRFR